MEARGEAEAGSGETVEDAEQRVAVALVVPGDQFGVIEVVAGIEPDTFRQSCPEGFFVRLIEQRDLDAVHLGGVGLDEGVSTGSQFLVQLTGVGVTAIYTAIVSVIINHTGPSMVRAMNAAAIDPAITCPSTPMFHSPARKGKIKA